MLDYNWKQQMVMPANAPAGSTLYTAEVEGGRLIAACDPSRGARVVNVAFESDNLDGCTCPEDPGHPQPECPGKLAPARWPTFTEIQSAVNLLLPRGVTVLLPIQTGARETPDKPIAFFQLFEGQMAFERIGGPDGRTA